MAINDTIGFWTLLFQNGLRDESPSWTRTSDKIYKTYIVFIILLLLPIPKSGVYLIFTTGRKNQKTAGHIDPSTVIVHMYTIELM